MLNKIPVYIFNGFLESGKTSFVREIMSDPNFAEGEKTLFIQCEEGIEEFSDAEKEKFNLVSAAIESPEDVSPAAFKKLETEHVPERILIEYNGMWKIDDLIPCFPARWELFQIVTTVNAETFPVYSNNIGAMMFEHLSTADLIIFNRCTDENKEAIYEKNIRAMNPRATIFLDGVDGSSEDYNKNMPLPFDIDADIIEISDKDYGIWYVDAMGEPAKYDGKTVRFTGMVYTGDNIPKNTFVPGRFGMVCCADDISFIGFLCKWNKADTLKKKDWVTVTASISVDVLPQYKGEGPVLNAIEVLPAEKIKDELVYFS